MSTLHGSIVALSVSKKKGIPKTNVSSVRLTEDWGIEGDVHAGRWHRQVSFLALESIEKIRAKGLKVRPGAFAENITTQFLNIAGLHPGERICVGDAEFEVTQIGKECHTRCAIFYRAGDCVMPTEGVFAKVLKGGTIHVGDLVDIFPASDFSVPSTNRAGNHEEPIDIDRMAVQKGA